MAKIAIIGAGGFIGAWVCEYIHHGGKHTPVACFRSWTSAVRTARFGIEGRICDMGDRDSMVAAIKDCDYVVSAAMVPGPPEEGMVQTLIDACLAAGTRKLVYLSSMAIYGDGDGVFTEDAVLAPTDNAYSNGKRKGEARIVAHAGRLHVTILRPTLVYGPYSKTWSIKFGRCLMTGKWGGMGSHGEGNCNLVYVTDLVRAILQSFEAGHPSGSAYNIDGAYGVSWNRFLLSYGKALGAPVQDEMDWRKLAARVRLYGLVRDVGKFALGNFRDLVMRVYNANELTRGMMQATETGTKLTPTASEMNLFSSRAEFPAGKARSELGYEPAMSFEDGLATTAQWFHHEMIS